MQREALLARIRETPRWDVLVIGGGATGLGCAIDAAARGYSTLLVEKNDFAAATSSRSTKLIHGGVRYLKQGNLRLVRESLQERGRLLQNASHLVHPLPFIVPTYGFTEKVYLNLGLHLYGWLSGTWEIGKTTSLNKGEVLQHLPNLQEQKLKGGILYYDGQFDDSRLALALMRTLMDFDGAAINYFPVQRLVIRESVVRGAVCINSESQEEFTVQARVVINAAGIYSDSIRRLEDPSSPQRVVFSQGSHVVVSQKFLSGDHGLMIPKTHDGRVLFAIPWKNRLVIGTTDQPKSAPELNPKPLSEEIDFLLEHAGMYLKSPPSRSDIRAVYSGVRGLAASDEKRSTAAMPRDHSVAVSSGGLVSITGGKWTTYRKMAADTVDLAGVVGDLPKRRSVTAKCQVHGKIDPSPDPFGVYGNEAPKVRELCATSPEWASRLHSDFPFLRGEVIWACRMEQARTVADVLARRFRLLFLDSRAALEAAPDVAELMAGELGRDERWKQDQENAFRNFAESFLP